METDTGEFSLKLIYNSFSSLYVLALSWKNKRSHTQAIPPWSLPYCRLDIAVTAPRSVCSVLWVNVEPASAFLLLLVLCAMLTYSFMRLLLTGRQIQGLLRVLIWWIIFFLLRRENLRQPWKVACHTKSFYSVINSSSWSVVLQ